MKATYLPSEDATKEILELRKQNEALNLELEKAKILPLKERKNYLKEKIILNLNLDLMLMEKIGK